MLRARRIAAAALAAVLAGMAGAAAWAAAAPAPAAKASESQELDFLIYKPSSTVLIGRGHYAVAVHGEEVAIDGRSDFFDGEYDVESERLRASAGGDPRLVRYEHSFFGPHGAPQRVARVDAPSGRATCVTYSGTQGSTSSKVLELPADTYAGASVLVPIADELKRGASRDLGFHVFDCASGPRIFSLHVDMQQGLWSYLPQDGALVRADARPVFGWFDVFLKPFVPEVRLWFDPRRNFGFMGGLLARYYRGPEVMLVRIPAPLVVPPPSAAAAQAKAARNLAAAGASPGLAPSLAGAASAGDAPATGAPSLSAPAAP
ncbi:MAG TPA: hypothetical protein VFB33_02775 [Candidatus Binataceae bacterium]|nr:hypothetical protein [Candidatus Binataceae bacterium]